MLLINEKYKFNKAEKAEVSDTTMLNRITTAGFKIFIILFTNLILSYYYNVQKHNLHYLKPII